MQYEKSVGIVIYRKKDQPNSQLEFLLLEAPRLSAKELKENDKTYWAFPKGKQEKGETDTETAIRETREETGITLPPLDPNFKEIEKYFYKREGELINKTIHYYLTSVPYNTDVVISNEHLSYEWATKDRSMELLKIKPAREMLQKAISHITSGNSQLSML